MFSHAKPVTYLWIYSGRFMGVSMSTSTLDSTQLAINTIRTLSMDAVQAANSGHPGTPMALAPVAYALWNEVLRYDPADPLWPGRDRFVLSCGHASMLLYSLIHLAGVKQVRKDGQPNDVPAVSLEDIKNFRQWQSLTPGHPEHGHTFGVETTTGPLGQGCGNSVGMAIAERWLAARFNQPGFQLFDYNVFAICSDGDLMEGVTNEAASLAGHLKLSNLCWIYDDNRITIEGETDLAFSEDVGLRFQGLGWNTIHVDDANDLEALRAAYSAFQANDDAPTLILVRSHIGFGSPHKQDSHEAHGSPLGEPEVVLTKEAYGWPVEPKFFVPKEVPKLFQKQLGERGAKASSSWYELFADYKAKFPELAATYEMMLKNELPAGWDAELPEFPADAKGLATRASAGQVLNAIAAKVPWLMGGSADLAPSTNTLLKFEGAGSFEPDNHGGRNMHFGIREHGMAAAVNGMALSGIRPYGATFFVFSDYLRPSMRLASIMHVPSIFVFTHDSIGVGEDGPTHQPVEHLAAARAIPGLIVLRPSDANEAREAWRTVMQLKDQPAALILTRQNLPTLDRAKYACASNFAKGAYVLATSTETPHIILIGTGSEVSLCVEAYEKLSAAGVPSRVVSMPSWELFEKQDEAYRSSVLPAEVTARVVVEAGVRQGWDRYLGSHGKFIGVEHFGASAPAQLVFESFGLTADNVLAQAQALLKK
jgi:transketolase